MPYFLFLVTPLAVYWNSVLVGRDKVGYQINVWLEEEQRHPLVVVNNAFDLDKWSVTGQVPRKQSMYFGGFLHQFIVRFRSCRIDGTLSASCLKALPVSVTDCSQEGCQLERISIQ